MAWKLKLSNLKHVDDGDDTERGMYGSDFRNNALCVESYEFRGRNARPGEKQLRNERSEERSLIERTSIVSEYNPFRLQSFSPLSPLVGKGNAI